MAEKNSYFLCDGWEQDRGENSTYILQNGYHSFQTNYPQNFVIYLMI